MDSGTNDLNSRERLRWGDASKVYTRKGKRKAALISDNDNRATNTATATATTATPQATNSNEEIQKENIDVQGPNLQTLEFEEPKLAEQEKEQPDARHQDQAISEPHDSLNRISNRDVSAGDEQVVASHGEEVQDGGSGPLVEPDGSDGCQPMVQDNHIDEPDRSIRCQPVTQENHIEEPNGNIGCQPLVQENHVDEPDGSIGCQPVVQGNYIEKQDGSIRCQLDVVDNHIDEPDAVDNHIDDPDGSLGCQPVAQDNHIDKPDGTIRCQPVVQDNRTDEQDGSLGCSPVMLDNHIDEQDGSLGCPPVMQDNHIDEPDVNLRCQLVVQDNPVDEPDGSLRHPPMTQDNFIEEPDGSTQCQPMVQDNHMNALSSGYQPEIIEVVKPGPIITRLEDRVRIHLSGARPVDEIRDLKRKLESELYQVRDVVKKLEANELQLTAYDNTADVTNIGSTGAVPANVAGAYGHPQFPRNYVIKNRTLVRVNSEVGSVGHQEVSLFRPPSILVTESNHGVGELVEKEKRTPKANQYYTNSEFLLGKDRLPTESNKKLKPNGNRKKHGGEFGHGFGFNFGSEKHKNQVFRRCSALLQKLMKHNYGWVFNKPVDAYALGLHDYHDIIKHPMDLGTIKTRLSQNWYKSPREFAEDVRLVFRNAMTYNPKGQDVHVMAEQMSKIFEEKWAAIEADLNPNWSLQVYHDSGLPTPTSRKTAPPSFVSAPVPASVLAPQMRTFDRSESITRSVDTKMKPSFHYRTPVPKKPKAKDPNKRDMTYEEKQKLSTNLQSLPSEKLDAIVQIIKKRNSSLSQHDDEIEVDIDSVDAETLWELDRFVTNYKKSLSKNRKKAEIAQARAAQNASAMTHFPVVADSQKASRSREANYPITTSPPRPAQGEKLVDNASRSSSSSSSSSSDSGSSSSDSDSDSSSAYGSDAGR
ncbi:PREDICTED: transcription factor GTE4-like isoform X3 [Ipomoea nil]|uniref:transcription factor GTE4-like isoform X3 n=1 Tax=Ipomoea nil TaxID=35883 RepID=UPI000901A660|nr:PREDICTED: transcription factor GTE4-like isoform X3 [Ipomoea nil]